MTSCHLTTARCVPRLLILFAVTAVAVASLNAKPPESITDGTGLFTTQLESLGINLGDPISANDGSHYFYIPLLDLGGPLPLTYTINYRLNRWWNQFYNGNFEDNVFGSLLRASDPASNGTAVEIYLHHSEFLVFNPNPGTGDWELDRHSPTRYQLKESGEDSDGYFYLMDPIRELVYIFEKVTAFCSENRCPARLLHILDRNGNRHDYTYFENRFRPESIADGLGRSLNFSFPTGSVATVTDQVGRTVTFAYENGATDLNNQKSAQIHLRSRGPTPYISLRLRSVESQYQADLISAASRRKCSVHPDDLGSHAQWYKLAAGDRPDGRFRQYNHGQLRCRRQQSDRDAGRRKYGRIPAPTTTKASQKA